MSTPWGKINESSIYAVGIGNVSTPGHGGMYVTGEAAKREGISESCLKRAINWDSRYYFEEDCDWAILAWELPKLWPKIFKHSNPEIQADPKKYLLHTLSAWNADYLLEIGVEPEPEGYAYFKERDLDQKMRKEKHPDLIICAMGRSSFCRCPEGSVKVETADGLEYLVTQESYHARSGLNLLSKCVRYTGPIGVAA